VGGGTKTRFRILDSHILLSQAAEADREFHRGSDPGSMGLGVPDGVLPGLWTLFLRRSPKRMKSSASPRSVPEIPHKSLTLQYRRFFLGRRRADGPGKARHFAAYPVQLTPAPAS